MVLAEFAMFPTDKGESVSQFVAEILNIIDLSEVHYRLTPMGTILEGEWEEVFDVIGRCFHHLKEESSRISVNIKVDYRAGELSRIESKTEKVAKLLGKKLRQ